MALEFHSEHTIFTFPRAANVASVHGSCSSVLQIGMWDPAAPSTDSVISTAEELEHSPPGEDFAALTEVLIAPPKDQIC